MIIFQVDDMTCGHCVSTVTRAVAEVAPGARVDVDLTTHRVAIEAETSRTGTIREAIERAGFTPVGAPIEAA